MSRFRPVTKVNTISNNDSVFAAYGEGLTVQNASAVIPTVSRVGNELGIDGRELALVEYFQKLNLADLFLFLYKIQDNSNLFKNDNLIIKPKQFMKIPCSLSPRKKTKCLEVKVIRNDDMIKKIRQNRLNVISLRRLKQLVIKDKHYDRILSHLILELFDITKKNFGYSNNVILNYYRGMANTEFKQVGFDDQYFLTTKMTKNGIEKIDLRLSVDNFIYLVAENRYNVMNLSDFDKFMNPIQKNKLIRYIKGRLTYDLEHNVGVKKNKYIEYLRYMEKDQFHQIGIGVNVRASHSLFDVNRTIENLILNKMNILEFEDIPLNGSDKEKLINFIKYQLHLESKNIYH